MLRRRLVLPLALLAILAASQPAHALSEVETTVSPPDLGAPADEEIEFEDECVESEDDEAEAAEETEEECEEAEAEGFSPAEDCYLRTARARVVAYPDRNIMRLTVG